MFKQFTIAFAATGLALTSTAAIAGAREPSPAPAATDAPKPAAQTKSRYCIKTLAATGSIVNRMVCKTRDQWREEGVDPTKLN